MSSTKEITVTLEACEPMELLRFPFEDNVWIKLLPGHYWEEVEIRGEPQEIWNFIELHWDREVANEYVPEVKKVDSDAWIC
jgi:hypothetical protein